MTSSTLSSAPALTDYAQFWESVPDEAMLGSILWFGFSGVDIPMEEVRQRLAQLGLSDTHLRKDLRPTDAFAKAVKELAKTDFAEVDGVSSVIMVRKIGKDGRDGLSDRRLVLERSITKEGRRRQLLYDEVAEIVYTHPTRAKDGTYSGERLEIVRKTPPGVTLTEAEEAHLASSLAALRNRVEHWKTHLDSHAVRSFVRDHLVSLSATQVKTGGGVYFVAQRHKAQLRLLREFVLNLGPGCDFNVMPLPNVTEQREMLARAFEEEALGEAEQLVGQLSRVLADTSRNVSPATLAKFNAEWGRLQARIGEYEQLTSRRVSNGHTTMQLLFRQLSDLSGRVKAQLTT